jgi:thymidylate synthase (FAD)
MPNFKVEFVEPGVARATLLNLPALQGAADLLATITRGYKQVYSPHPPTGEERAELLEDIRRTKLRSPLEFINTIWLITGVTRAFTHQLVRYRIGTQFVQESMRFADKREAQVLLTPELTGSARGEFMETAQEAFAAYSRMLDAKVPIQAARGILPHHTLTSVFFGCSLATLAHIYEQRMCCQAQHHEWPGVVQQMKAALPLELQAFIPAPWESGKPDCGFGATFDRPCALRHLWPKPTDKFQIGVETTRGTPSEAWVQTRVKTGQTGPLSEVKLPPDLLYQKGEMFVHVHDSKLVARMRGNRHFLIYPTRSISLFSPLLQKAAERGVTELHITDLDTHRTYMCTLADFLDKSVLQPADQVYPERRYLPLGQWTWVENGETVHVPA